MRMKEFGGFGFGYVMVLVAIMHQNGSIQLDMCRVCGSEAQ